MCGTNAMIISGPVHTLDVQQSLIQIIVSFITCVQEIQGNQSIGCLLWVSTAWGPPYNCVNAENFEVLKILNNFANA